MHLPPAVDQHLRDRHELVTRRELADLGVGRGATSRLVTAGALAPQLPGVLRGTERPGTRLQPVAAAVRYLTDGFDDTRPVTVSGAAALAMAGLEGVELPSTPLLAVGADRRVRLADAPFALVREPVPPASRQRIDGLPVASVARALLDLSRAEKGSDERIRTAVDAARWQRRLDVTRWLGELQAHPRAARRLLRLHAAGAFEQESEGERAAYAVLFARMPPPDCQVWLLPSIRVDFAYLHAALVIEYLGRAAHADALDRDTTRTLALRRGGYDVVAVTHAMLQDPADLIEHIADQRRRRDALALRGLLPRSPLPPQRDRSTPLRTLTPQR